MNKEIILKKIGTNGKEYIWSLKIFNDKVIVIHGQTEGKLQKEEKDISAWSPKNVGKKNATTSEEQATIEMIRKAKRKIDSGYNIIAGEEYIQQYISETYVAVDTTIPKPTLAKNASPYSKDYNTSMRKILAQKNIMIQRKLDGNRALINRKTGDIYSRTRKLIISLPELGKKVIDSCKHLSDDITFVDGELFSSDLTFNEIQSIIRKSKPESINKDESRKIKFNLFDIVSNLEQHQRIALISEFIEENDFVKIVGTETIESTEENIQEAHDRFVAEGDEGVIIRFFEDGGYQQKRSNSMYKFKNFIDEEFEVIGFYSEKNNLNKLGGIILKNDTNAFKALPSMTEDEKKYILSNQEEFLGKFATVRFQKYDDKTNTPIFGTIKGFTTEEDI